MTQTGKPATTFGPLIRGLHWIIALLIFALFFLGLWFRELDYYSPWYETAPALHTSFGIVFMVLLLARLIWRFTHSPPTPLGDNRVEHALAAIVHAFLYALMIALAVSGYLYATADGKPADLFWLIQIPVAVHAKSVADTAGDLHAWFAYAIIAFAGLHLVGALKHHIIDKDDTLRRMVSGVLKNGRSTE